MPYYYIKVQQNQMKRNNSKNQTIQIRNNHDYLNFIRKNKSVMEQHQKQQRKHIGIITDTQNPLVKRVLKNYPPSQAVNSWGIFDISKARRRYDYPQTNQIGIDVIHLLTHKKTTKKQQKSAHQNANQQIEETSQQIKKQLRNLQHKDSKTDYKIKVPIESQQISFKFPQLINNRIKLQNIKKKVERTINSGLSLDHNQKNYKQVDPNIMIKTFYNKSKEQSSIQQEPESKQEMYQLLPSFKHKNDFMKNIVKKGKRSAKKLQKNQNNRNHFIEKQLQRFLESNIILRNNNRLELKNNPLKFETQNQNQQLQDHLINISDQIRPKIQQPPPVQSQKQSQVVPSTQKKKEKPIINFQNKDSQLSIYQNKIRSYRQFLFQMNLAHRKFDTLTLKDDPSSLKIENKYKFYIGKGNNSLLVKSLLKRRFWWTIQQNPKKANFVWSQLKINSFYQFMPKADITDLYDTVNPSILAVQTSKKGKQKVQVKNPPKAGIFRAPLPQSYRKILTANDVHLYQQFLRQADLTKVHKFANRLKYFPQNYIQERTTDKKQCHLHNHFQFNYHIGNKKALFYNLKQYYQLMGKNVFTIIPLTYHIQKGVNDPEYHAFHKEFKRLKDSEKQNENLKNKNVWIVKPGELSNRGNGITVIDEVYELNSILKKKQKHSNGIQKTYIVQKYIQKPMLYNRRKFDIRHYMMASRLHGRMRAYWFGQGYIRTSSTQYNIEEVDNPIMHLTNDAIQKYSEGYGRYQEGNKISYNEFQRYLDATYPQKKYNFTQSIYPKMRGIALDAFKSTYIKLDSNRYQHTFEVFGLDFMIDSNFNVWLIQVNTNPCLQLSSNILSRIIPTMLEHTFRLTLDVIYPPPTQYPNTIKYLAPDNPLERLQFQMIFDEGRDGIEVQQLYKNAKILDINNIDQEDETYQNEGKELDFQEEVE